MGPCVSLTVGKRQGVGVAISPGLLEEPIVARPDFHVDVVTWVRSRVEAEVLAVELDGARGALGREVEELVLRVRAVVGEAVCPEVSFCSFCRSEARTRDLHLDG